MTRVKVTSYRIWTQARTVKFAGTGESSWFASIEDARAKAGETDMIFEYDSEGRALWEVL